MGVDGSLVKIIKIKKIVELVDHVEGPAPRLNQMISRDSISTTFKNFVRCFSFKPSTRSMHMLLLIIFLPLAFTYVRNFIKYTCTNTCWDAREKCCTINNCIDAGAFLHLTRKTSTCLIHRLTWWCKFQN